MAGKKGRGNPNPNPATRFKPGVSGNPGGKPANLRNSLTTNFLKILAADFEANGKVAIETMRVEDPSGYVKAIASLLPKEFVIDKPLDGMSDDELAAVIAELRELRQRVDAAGGGNGTPPQREQAGELPTLQ